MPILPIPKNFQSHLWPLEEWLVLKISRRIAVKLLTNSQRNTVAQRSLFPGPSPFPPSASSLPTPHLGFPILLITSLQREGTAACLLRTPVVTWNAGTRVQKNSHHFSKMGHSGAEECRTANACPPWSLLDSVFHITLPHSSQGPPPWGRWEGRFMGWSWRDSNRTVSPRLTLQKK